MQLPVKPILAALLTVTITLGISSVASAQKPPFGTPEDVEYANALWAALEKWNLRGPDSVKGVPSPGQAPHGAVVETLSTRVTVQGHSGEVYVKRNYGGEGVTPSKVSADRSQYMGPITVMFRREPGYDSDNKNWFWAKFLPDGSLDKNPKGMPLAGRVAKGMSQGCIACHHGAAGDDYLFTNDASRIDK